MRFWFRPDDATAAIYGVPPEGGSLRRVGDSPSAIHLGGRFTTIGDGEEVELTRMEDGRKWRFATDGESLTVSADGSQVAWVVSLGESVPGRAPPPREHWRARLDVGEPYAVEVPADYALVDWTASGAWLLARVTRDRDDLAALVWFDPDSGEERPLLDGRRLRTFRTSPGRSWLAVTRAFEDDPSADGLYLLDTDGKSPPRKLELVGGYQWRDDDRLLVVPIEPGASSMAVWQVEAVSGTTVQLTEPATTPFRIAAAEWSAAPGGRYVAFRSADDDAIWVLALP